MRSTAPTPPPRTQPRPPLMYDSPITVYTPPDAPDVERTAPLRSLDDPVERTAVLGMPGQWRWPDADPDNRAEVTADARAALRPCDRRTLPVREAARAGLRNLAPREVASGAR